MSENSEHMNAIATAIAKDPAANILNYEELTMIFMFEDDGFNSGSFGYAYVRNEKPVPFSLDEEDAIMAAEDYWKFLKREGDKGPVSMIFQFNKVSRKVNADFEYEDQSRWDVTLDNRETKVEELQPNLY